MTTCSRVLVVILGGIRGSHVSAMGENRSTLLLHGKWQNNTSFTPMQDDRVYRHLLQFSLFVAFALGEVGGFLRTECTLHISSNKFGRVCRSETSYE
jgi:hypothetical protein